MRKTSSLGIVAVALMFGGSMACLGGMFWAALYPHGSVARFVIALLKASPFSV